MQFFVLRVASNKEDRVRDALNRKIKIEAVESMIGRVLVPIERVRSMKGGVKKESDRKLYPGYVFVELELDKNGMIPEKVWFLIKETDGVGDFIGSNQKPIAMSPKDQAKMLEEAERPDDGGEARERHDRTDDGERRYVAAHACDREDRADPRAPRHGGDGDPAAPLGARRLRHERAHENRRRRFDG